MHLLAHHEAYRSERYSVKLTERQHGHSDMVSVSSGCSVNLWGSKSEVLGIPGVQWKLFTENGSPLNWMPSEFQTRWNGCSSVSNVAESCSSVSHAVSPSTRSQVKGLIYELTLGEVTGRQCVLQVMCYRPCVTHASLDSLILSVSKLATRRRSLYLILIEFKLLCAAICIRFNR